MRNYTKEAQMFNSKPSNPSFYGVEKVVLVLIVKQNFKLSSIEGQI